MKTILSVTLIVAILIGAGLLGVRTLIDREISVIKSDLNDIKQRLKKIEDASKIAPLQPGADMNSVINKVNALYYKFNSLEGYMKDNLSKTNSSIEKQRLIHEDAFKKLTNDIITNNKEIKDMIQKIMFDAAMANIRGHILKARADLQYKNIGTAKNELDFILTAFEKAKTNATDDNKRIIEELQGILKKAKSEIDIDLPSAISRIDLLWHDMSKLLRTV